MTQKSTPTVRLEKEPHRDAHRRLYTAYEKLRRAYQQQMAEQADVILQNNQESKK